MNVGNAAAASSDLKSTASRWSRRILHAAFLAVLCFTVNRQAFGQGAPGIGSVPSPAYFAGLAPFYDGNFNTAEGIFAGMAQGGIKNPLAATAWIDSICYHTMAGECDYQMGRFPAALQRYNAALNIYLANANWMIQVQFPNGINPAQPGQIKGVPWGQSARNLRFGNYPATINIGQGQINNNAAVQRGGVVQMPVLFPIHVQEIVRCTALALRRRRELLGPLAQYDPMSNDLVVALARRPGPPNHWSEAWIDLQLGLAYSAAGKDTQAKSVLERAMIAGGEFDHPFTCIVLLELGRIALQAGDFRSASNFFIEASYSAAVYEDPGVLEEAFRYGQLTHLMSNSPGLYPPMIAAAGWARSNDLRQLQASLMVLTAENYCKLQQTAAASTLVTSNIRSVINGSNIPASRLGARLNLVTATAMFQGGQVATGETAMNAVMNFQRRGGSLWYYHMNLVDTECAKGSITDRTAMELYSQVLRDPTPADWVTDPLESLSALIVPHGPMWEHWFDVAIRTRQPELALEIADRCRRHRFLNTLDYGGRLLNLRWLLEGPNELLDQKTVLQKQDLLTRFPGYDNLMKQGQQLRAELQAQPLVPANAQDSKAYSEKLARLSEISLAQETILREMAVRREPCNLVFPPVRTTKEVQMSLKEGQGLLAFFSSNGQLWAFLMSNNRYGFWPVKGHTTLPGKIRGFLQHIGNNGQNFDLTSKILKDDDWKKSAQDILQLLTKDSQASLAEQFKELIIIPEGLLWYLPFEALQVPGTDGPESLISRVRMRYAPTVSLGVNVDPRPRKPAGNTAVVLGRMFPRDEDTVTENAFNELGPKVPGVTAIKGAMPGPSAIYGSLFDRLVVYTEITPPRNNVYEWTPVQLDHGLPGSQLAQWFSLPIGGPDQVVLPGFRTSAEFYLDPAKNKGLDVSGSDLFLSVCGLMGTGARTVLISRWRTGGQNSFDLVREFVQELPFTTADDAWQRSIFLASDTALNPELEPRLKLAASETPPKAEHPFFWAGYLLADTGVAPKKTDDNPAEKVLKPLAVPAAQAPAVQPPAAPGLVPKGPDGKEIKPPAGALLQRGGQQ
jgi:tetratricopeptide (TPR) repeat protein